MKTHLAKKSFNHFKKRANKKKYGLQLSISPRVILRPICFDDNFIISIATAIVKSRLKKNYISLTIQTSQPE